MSYLSLPLSLSLSHTHTHTHTVAGFGSFDCACYRIGWKAATCTYKASNCMATCTSLIWADLCHYEHPPVLSVLRSSKAGDN